jgi:uncharacterized lipoprotein YmbA
MKWVIMLMSLLLSGCFATTPTTNNYQVYVDGMKTIAHSAAMLETARLSALVEIANKGDNETKNQAIQAIQSGSVFTPVVIEPPK